MTLKGLFLMPCKGYRQLNTANMKGGVALGCNDYHSIISADVHGQIPKRP